MSFNSIGLNSFVTEARYALANPFGVVFEFNDEGRIVCPLGSIINCIGYNDFLERIVGITRVAIAIFFLATSLDRSEKILAGMHFMRGLLEFMGNFEGCLLMTDIIVTVLTFAQRYFTPTPTPTLTPSPTEPRTQPTEVQSAPTVAALNARTYEGSGPIGTAINLVPGPAIPANAS